MHTKVFSEKKKTASRVFGFGISNEVFRKTNYFLSIIFLTLFLSGCGEEPKNSNNVMSTTLGVPVRMHEKLTVNVLDYKLSSSKEETPLLGEPPKKMKHVAVRLIISHPGKHRGIKPVTFPEIIDRMEITHPGLKRPVAFAPEYMAPSLDQFSFDNADFSSKLIKQGESKTMWFVSLISKDVNPPYKLTIYPKDEGIGNARGVSVDLK